MKTICAKCGRDYNAGTDGPRQSCASCGGQLIRVADDYPAGKATGSVAANPPAGAGAAPLELAGEPAVAGMNCPNCGKWIEPNAQICTSCGFSRRLARTLTTRVGTPEMLQVKSKGAPGSPEAPEIDAERAHRRANERRRTGSGDALRLIVAVMWLLALAAIIMTAPARLLEQAGLRMPGLLTPPRFDALNASLMMLLFLVVAVPIAGIAVRIAAAMTNTEISTYFSWVRTGGALAAALVTMELVFTADQRSLHLPLPLLLAACAIGGLVALLLFTWYLHDVRLSDALVLWLATLVGAAVGLFAAAVAFGWVASMVGIDPVIPPIHRWAWPKGGG